MKYLIANIGSSSKKYAAYDDGAELATFWYEGIDAQNGFDQMLNDSYSKGVTASTSDYSAVGIRIVAPGTFFQKHRVIDDAYIERLKTLRTEDPLHIVPILTEIEAVRARLGDIRIIGLSDSAFHVSLPAYAKTYGIRLEDSESLDIKRFGYHGFSFASVVRSFQNTGNLPEKLVVVHLGSGASVAAIQKGICIDTSMGFSPLEGLVMQSRAGDIDTIALIRLARAKEMSLDELETYLYTQSGLRGISGRSGDMRDLLELEEQGDRDACLAIEVFVYRIKKYIGAYAAALGGIDTLVLTGTIGECAPKIRERICNGLEHLGLMFDNTKNTSVSGSGDMGVTPGKILSIHTEEIREMAFAVREILETQ